VVDDNADAADSVAKILGLMGHEVRCAYNGYAALKEAHAFHPEVFVLDIGLPGMDGYEVARRLRALDAFAHAPLVAVTGYGQDEDRARSRDAGFDYHLTKPIDPEVLADIIALSDKLT
jgi:CheY-like chemotaxis protein